MFDAVTSALLRSAPKLPGLNPDEIPAILTKQYADLASRRLREVSEEIINEEWNLERIANSYELFVSLQNDGDARKSAAFVAATARQIIARQIEDKKEFPNINREYVHSRLSSIILFLISEQYADANEAAKAVTASKQEQTYEATILSSHIRDLGMGNLSKILERSLTWRNSNNSKNLVESIEEKALNALFEALSSGIELLAAQLLGEERPAQSNKKFEIAQQAFETVIKLSVQSSRYYSEDRNRPLIVYPGPYHLASLLLSASHFITHASLINIPPPSGSDPKNWRRWLKFRAEKCPYVWRNHREAINKGFYETEVSSVLILPTGAGKTTVSSLKIAAALTQGKKVLFLAPTHALVEQLTEDLQEMFPRHIMGSTVSSDGDFLISLDAIFQDIEVMTPERCLAFLSFAPKAFSEVGLLVFDECHLLSPQTGKIRRAIDAMLCILGFHQICPDSNFLFMSAMLNNGKELAEWLKDLTGRNCIAVDLLWKPSRQARGVIIYDKEELRRITTEAIAIQRKIDVTKNKISQNLRTAAKEVLTAKPFAVWGIQNNWLLESEPTSHCTITPLLDDKVKLTGKLRGTQLYLTPNVNKIAVRLAISAAKSNIKTIVFVNTKQDSVSVSRDISTSLSLVEKLISSEQSLWENLEIELGDLKHSVLERHSSAVPHNASMLRLERDLAERIFKRADGANVIVATPTLAQGLNLPAQFAILAGDKRTNSKQNGREAIESHEILNAAARAGRAGHLANGLVLLIPEPVISFNGNDAFDVSIIDKLKSVLPEDDRCVKVEDPLEIVLDRLTTGQHADPDVKYLVNRLTVLNLSELIGESDYIFDLKRSLGAFNAKNRNSVSEFEAKIELLKNVINSQNSNNIEYDIAILASKSGLSIKALKSLKDRIIDDISILPVNVEGWLEWMIRWLQEDEYARSEFLDDITNALLSICGKGKIQKVEKQDLDILLAGLVAWINGKNIQTIEKILGGDPLSNTSSNAVCPRARELVSSIIPRCISFTLGLISHVINVVNPFDSRPELERQLIDCLSTCVRKGYNNVEMLTFAANNKNLKSRVQVHLEFNKIII